MCFEDACSVILPMLSSTFCVGDGVCLFRDGRKELEVNLWQIMLVLLLPLAMNSSLVLDCVFLAFILLFCCSTICVRNHCYFGIISINKFDNKSLPCMMAHLYVYAIFLFVLFIFFCRFGIGIL